MSVLLSNGTALSVSCQSALTKATGESFKSLSFWVRLQGSYHHALYWIVSLPP